jgi:hypothetical protein
VLYFYLSELRHNAGTISMHYHQFERRGAILIGAAVAVHCLSDRSAFAQAAQPVQVASADDPVDIAVDGSSVYWTDTRNNDGPGAHGAIMKCPITGCGAIPTVLASGQRNPHGITVDKSAVYWTNSVEPGAVLKVPISGGSGSPSIIASDQVVPTAIAVDRSNVYWTNGSGNAFGKNSVMRIALAGGTPVVVAPRQVSLGDRLVVDQDCIYWTRYGGVVRAPKDGQRAAVQWGPVSYGVVSVAVDSTHVYLANRGPGSYGAGEIVRTTIRRPDLTNVAPTLRPTLEHAAAPASQTTLAVSPLANSLTLDSENLYWTDEAMGTVMSVPIGGGLVTTLATDQHNPRKVAVDGTSVYWITGSPMNGFPNRIMKIGKNHASGSQWATEAKASGGLPTSANGSKPGFDETVAEGVLAMVDFQSCSGAGGPTGFGHATIEFAPSGVVRSAVVDQPPLAGTSVGECIAAKLRAVRLTPFSGGDRQVEKNFVIR